jgi:uncharacterized protein DUF4235
MQADCLPPIGGIGSSACPKALTGSVPGVKAIMTIIYKPFGFAAGMLAALVGRRIFDFVWGKIDEEDPPKGTTKEAPLVKILGAAALEGVIFKIVRTATNRQTAKVYYYFTGFWPGERRPEPE